MALKQVAARRVSALTRWGHALLVLMLGGLLGALFLLANTLAWRPAAREQIDLSASGELRVQRAATERLEALPQPVQVTALFSSRPTRRQQLFERLCFGRPERELFARMELEVRQRAIERVRAWLERLAVLSRGRLSVEWLDRERDLLAYEGAIERHQLTQDGRVRRYLGGIEGLESGSAQRRTGRAAYLAQGVRELARTELPEAASVMDEVELVDLVVVECEGRRELLFLEPDLVGIDHCHLWATGIERAPSLIELRVEAALLAAAERVLPDGAPRVGWIASLGLGMREMSALVGELDRLGMRVRAIPVNLREEGPPQDLDVLLAFAPQRAFEPAEQAALERFLESGGALLAVEDARADGRPSAWNDALAAYGLSFGRGRVSQVRDASELGTERSSWLRVERFNAANEITHAYATNGWSLELREACDVRVGGARHAGALVYRLLQLETPGSGGVAMTAEAELRQPWLDLPPFDGRPQAPQEERRAFVLGVALELPSGGRIAALGATWPFRDIGMRGDARFAAHVVRWLGDRPVSASGEPQRLGQQRFEVEGPLGPSFPGALADVERAQVLAVLCRYALPSAMLLLGCWIWWWRRRA
ncbi:MAG: Gldg family protein [Planctomycetes bacterium]|nr:Gldg family protein [Planctomycetota bacterium]